MTALKTTARATGAWYLGLGLTGMVGFLVIRPTLHVPTDAALTLKNLTERAVLAHIGVALELGVVLTQAFAAIGFYKLLRSFDAVAAGATAAFGLMNALVVLISATCMQTALHVTTGPHLAPGGDVARTVQLLFAVSAGLWQAGGIFFGLWLIPMGQVVRTAAIMPPALGWILQAGGVGYVLSALIGHGLVGPPQWLIDSLAIPATIGEFWMIGYLLSYGIRPSKDC